MLIPEYALVTKLKLEVLRMKDNTIVVKGKYDAEIKCNEPIGVNIVHLREKRKMTQAQLADEAHMDIRRLRKYENDDIIPTLDDMKSICTVLEVSILALFLETNLKEVYCDQQTGLTKNTIQWLATLNSQNHNFINILNKLSNNKPLFKMIYNITFFATNGAIELIKNSRHNC